MPLQQHFPLYYFRTFGATKKRCKLNLKSAWWKILSVLLLAYVLVMGLLTPLKPGIESVENTEINETGFLSLKVTGYNTSFSENSSEISAWLWNDSTFLPATMVMVGSNNELTANFYLDQPLKSRVSSFILEAGSDGLMVKENCIQNTANLIMGSDTIRANAGFFMDSGGDAASYESLESSQSILKSINGQNLVIQFNSINLKPGDKLYLAKTDSARSFIAEINHDTPTPYLIETETNEVLALFQSKNSFSAEERTYGWRASVSTGMVVDLPKPDLNKAPVKGIPNREMLNETIRNLFLHVPMWFSMMILLTASFVYSILYLQKGKPIHDLIAAELVNVSLLFAFLGLATGSLWAKFTWSEHSPLFSFSGWWVNDVKLNGAAVGTLIYIAYRVLRGSVNEDSKRGRIAAVYNIFAYIMYMVFIMVLPRMFDSLHPGNGGNPAFSQYDLDNTLRPLFYAAVIGWTLLGVWLFSLRKRIKLLEEKILH
jgi:heme exporter protein C